MVDEAMIEGDKVVMGRWWIPLVPSPTREIPVDVSSHEDSAGEFC